MDKRLADLEPHDFLFFANVDRELGVSDVKRLHWDPRFHDWSSGKVVNESIMLVPFLKHVQEWTVVKSPTIRTLVESISIRINPSLGRLIEYTYTKVGVPSFFAESTEASSFPIREADDADRKFLSTYFLSISREDIERLLSCPKFQFETYAQFTKRGVVNLVQFIEYVGVNDVAALTFQYLIDAIRKRINPIYADALQAYFTLKAITQRKIDTFPSLEPYGYQCYPLSREQEIDIDSLPPSIPSAAVVQSSSSSSSSSSFQNEEPPPSIPSTALVQSIPSSSSSTVVSECSICLDETVTHTLVPCGHCCFCQSCANQLVKSSQKCPICRSSITMTMRLYFS